MTHNLGPARKEFFAPEFFLVVVLAFGLFSAASVMMLFGPLTGRAALLFDEQRVWTMLTYEVSVTPIIAYLLWERGWRWHDFAVKFTFRGALQGLGLAAVAWMASHIVLTLFSSSATASVSAAALPAAAASATYPLAGVFLAAVVKPLFEELLVCGFVVQSLRGRFGIALAVNASIALRMSFHLYQGPTAFINFAVFGLLFTLFYVRTGRLWPLIVAHAALEIVQAL